MKIFILFALCATLAWGRPDTYEYETCNGKEDDCAPGLACRLTKELIYQGQVIPVKQCMKPDAVFEVEQVIIDSGMLGKRDDVMTRTKRFLFNKCTSDAQCSHNFCCAFGKRCAPKLFEFVTCYFVDKHKCGCGDGLVCKQTTSIALPIIGIKFPIIQCVKAEAPAA